MPVPLGEAQLGPENAELNAARHLMLVGTVKLEATERTERGVAVSGKVDATPVEVFLDLDGRIRRGKCLCGHFRQYGIRNGPCRHMIALRSVAASTTGGTTAGSFGSVSRN
jgi:hypothetical protein